MEGVCLVKKGPESRAVREGFLEEEGLNPGFERKEGKHGLAEGKGAGSSSFRKLHPDSYEKMDPGFSCLENTMEDKPGPLSGKPDIHLPVPSELRPKFIGVLLLLCAH